MRNSNEHFANVKRGIRMAQTISREYVFRATNRARYLNKLMLLQNFVYSQTDKQAFVSQILVLLLYLFCVVYSCVVILNKERKV